MTAADAVAQQTLDGRSLNASPAVPARADIPAAGLLKNAHQQLVQIRCARIVV